MKNPKLHYIGFRGNPQLKNGGYYVAFGQLSKTAAKSHEKCVYGSMYLNSYDSEDSYNAAITKHQENGYTVNKR